MNYFTGQGGGYPIGYPPHPMQPYMPASAYSSPYSPFINPYQQQPIPTPPAPNSSALENVCVTPDGKVHGANGEGPIGYQTVEQDMAQTQQPVQQMQMGSNGGFNPFATYGIGNAPQQFFPMNPPVYYGANPYLTQQQYGTAGYNMPYGYVYNSAAYNFEQQFQNVVNSELYDPNAPSVDPFESLYGIILTDEEQQKAKMNRPIGYSYNGTPYYSNEQMTNQKKMYDNAKKTVVDFYVKLSKCAHMADGEEIDEEKMREIYDPDARVKKANAYVNPAKNYYEMSPDEIAYQNELTTVDQTMILERNLELSDQYWPILMQKRAEGFAKIKESHDKLLGLDPDNMNLKQYMANAGLLVVDAMIRESRRRSKNGTNMYDRNSYKAGLQQNNTQPISLYATDEYIPLEQKIKMKYEASKAKILQGINQSFTLPPPPNVVSPEEAAKREAFLKDAMRGIQI